MRGWSIALTQHILNELIDIHPLTQIEDTPDVWDCVTEDVDHKLFQCKRMASLFKTEYSDGRCTYSDNTRCCCENISDHCRYYSGKSRKIIKKMFPITMPYIPKDHYVLWLTRLNQCQENYLVRHT